MDSNQKTTPGHLNGNSTISGGENNQPVHDEKHLRSNAETKKITDPAANGQKKLDKKNRHRPLL